VLREALAKGADRAIHLEDDKFVGFDAFNTAKAFAAAIKDEQFDLIFPDCSRRLWLRSDGRESWPNCWAGRTPPSSCNRKDRQRHSREARLEAGYFQIRRYADACSF